MNVELIKRFLKEVSLIMVEEREHLIDEDSIVGDGDLGLTMSDGFVAAYDAIKDSDEKDCGKVLYFAGKAMSTKVPSTMGTLMASGLMQAGKALKGKSELDRKDVTAIFENYLEGVTHRGKAKVGEKTFIDGFYPAVEMLKSTEGEELSVSAEKASDAAMQGYKNTEGMIAVHGRAATRGEDSRKLLDPGALVAAYIAKGFYLSVK
ncbi:MAG: dihydroxyacetone kinase subunit L [Sphaerochaetaceae bacterium]|nr:dihydroxyacetone kinase subunit L [Sphaerochaetaceae bacterium]